MWVEADSNTCLAQYQTDRAEKSAERSHDAHEPKPTKLGRRGNS